MCFVFIWEQTATCATYILNWLVFITEMKSVYCAVWTGYLNKAVCASSLKGYLPSHNKMFTISAYSKKQHLHHNSIKCFDKYEQACVHLHVTAALGTLHSHWLSTNPIASSPFCSSEWLLHTNISTWCYILKYQNQELSPTKSQNACNETNLMH
jgi:hypothetical protein